MTDSDPENGDGSASRVSVVTATVSDADRVVDLWVDLATDQRAYDSHVRATESREAVRETYLRRIVAGEVLLARVNDPNAKTRCETEVEDEDQGHVLGFVSFGLVTDAYDRDGTRGAVYDLYVVPEARDAGVGRQLLDAAEANLTERGADSVVLEAMARNEGARRFYRRRGYREHRVELRKPLDE